MRYGIQVLGDIAVTAVLRPTDLLQFQMLLCISSNLTYKTTLPVIDGVATLIRGDRKVGREVPEKSSYTWQSSVRFGQFANSRRYRSDLFLFFNKKTWTLIPKLHSSQYYR